MSDWICPICSARSKSTSVPAVRESEWSVIRCADCGIEMLWPQPTLEQIAAIYDSTYYKAWGMAEGETDEVARMKKQIFAMRLDEVAEYRKSGNLLDVGTASGFLLEVAKDRGYEPYGIEMSSYSGGLAAKKFGADRIHIGPLETASFPAGHFDAITMCDLIEHVPDPIAALTKARDMLSDDGVLLIMTPDTGSLTNKLMGKRWTHYKLEHLFYFNKRSITLAAEKSGLSVVCMKRNKKVLKLRYLRSQFRVYHHWLFTPLTSALATVMPFLLDTPLKISIGEFVVLLRKKEVGKHE